ncbi:MAG: aspartate-alanine antiporter [Candidatus Erginobacter occultus]|nr:aspartate-alanine antiporter [Candidatus Erginobacter occultus]
MHWLVDTLRHYPELAVFLTLGLGYWVGNLKFGGFSLGAVTGTLLMGVLVGQLGITVSADLKSVFFLLFLFAVGYGVGPQFFRGLKSDGLPQVLFAVIICLICLAVTWVAARLAGFDSGTAAGLFAGSQTISAVIGVGTDTINNLGLDPARAKAMIEHIPVAYAVTYIFGTAGTAWILASLGPKLLGVNLPEACRAYEKKLSGGSGDGKVTAYREVIARSYRLKNPELAGKTVAAAEAGFGGKRVQIERIEREGKLLEPEPSTVLAAGDILAVAGRHPDLVELGEKLIGPEVEDRELLEVPVEGLEVVLTSKKAAGKTLAELAASEEVKREFHGVFLRRVTRGGQELPIGPGLKLDRGDRLRLVGAVKDVERIAAKIGYPDRESTQTDMVFVGLGILLGGLFGALAVRIGGISLSLSTSGGALIAGLVFGWLRSVHPTFGRIPAPSLWMMNSVGLTMFIAAVGIDSGPSFVAGFKELGLALFIAGVAATSIPMIVGVLLGRFVFKFDPAINLGVNAGARVTTAALGAITEAAGSQVPALGYTVPYAISNTLLIIWGIVIVLIT